ncbi:hypothetical protein PMAYCL1PPCAC_29886 [Pristionchus mayeri]|uniref:tRNA (guanine(37)-N1)-methyltransferase n=1 Tax=Pristionchus mayeri TaxID=1317129 RepID=A0AAN5DA77_9BILA|nr:hypothetical protein PMAYCL1PPCAC_29886 [Pristionchus mayeri]
MQISHCYVWNLIGFAQCGLSRVFARSLHTSIMTVTPSSEGEGTSSSIQIPARVRGMMLLDKEQFRASFKFPILRVEPKEVGRLRGCLLKYTIKQFGKSIKPIMDSADKQMKIIVLNPDVVNSDETRQEMLAAVGGATGNADRKITEEEFSLGFEEWDQRAIFRAVLPDGMEFSSFTQTGHLIHCNLTDELVPYGKIIGEILLAKNATCRTVVNKPDMISNAFRTFEVELLAGEGDYVVDTIEDGVKYRMDFTKVFWNSRLSHEHSRVIKQLSPSSLVFDACAGIGPFVIPAARKHNAPEVILANDLNPESVRWLKENMKINRVKESAIEVFNEDAAAFIRGPVAECIRKHESLAVSSRPDAARIIMNLPALAVTFLPAFRGMLHPPSPSSEGRRNETEEPFPVIIYCYLFAKAHEDVDAEWYVKRAKEMVEEQMKWEGVEIRTAHRVRTVSSRKEMFCMEIVVPWALMRSEEKEEEVGSSEEPSAKRSKTSEN